MLSYNFLIIDTSNHKPFVTLIINNEIVSVEFLEKNSLSVSLEEVVEKLLSSDFKLSFISVCYGPGNFSAMRTGIAFAFGLHLSLDIPIVSWDATVPFISSFFNVFVSVIDGGKKGCFVSIREKAQNSLILRKKPQFILFEQLPAFLQENNCICLVGPYLFNVKNFLQEKNINYFFEEKDPNFLFLKNFSFTLFKSKQYLEDTDIIYLKEFL